MLTVEVVSFCAPPRLMLRLNGSKLMVSVGALIAAAFPWAISCRRRLRSELGMEAWSALPAAYACSPGVAWVSQVTSTVLAYFPAAGWQPVQVQSGFCP